MADLLAALFFLTVIAAPCMALMGSGVHEGGDVPVRHLRTLPHKRKVPLLPEDRFL